MKIKTILLTLILTFLSTLSFANNDSELQTNERLTHYTDIRYESIDDVFENLTHRLILSLFGKNILVYFLPEDLPDSVIKEIKAMSPGDEDYYSRPFNSVLSHIMWVILFLVNVIAIGVLSLYFIWIGLERLLITSESGDFFGKNIDASKSNVKFVVVLFLILPLINFSDNQNNKYGYVSVIQLMAVKFVGIASYTGDKIFEIYANNTPNYYPQIQMPSPGAKAQDMLALIKYAACVNSESIDEEIKEIPFYFVRNGEGEYKAHSGDGVCELSVSIRFDTDTANIIKNNLEDEDIIPFSSDYLSIQHKEFKEIFSEILKKANLIAKKIIKTNFNVEKVEMSNKYDMETWVNGCDEFNDRMEEINIESAEKVVEFTYNAMQCLSLDYVNNFSKIKGVDNVFDYMKTKNYLGINSSKLELCVHNFNVKNKKQTEISDAGNIVNQKEEGRWISLDEAATIEWKTFKIEDCVKQSCSNFDSSSIYQCSSAISLAKEHFDRRNMAKKGWITSGAYIYKLFANIGVNNYGRTIINNFNVTYNKRLTYLMSADNIVFKKGEDIGEYNDNLTVMFKGFEHDNYQQEKVEVFNNLIDYNIQKFLKRSDTGSVDISQKYIKLFNNEITRLQVCLQKPLTITDQYSCGNVTAEIHELGVKLISVAISFKIGLFLAEMARVAHIPGNDESGSISQKGFLKSTLSGPLLLIAKQVIGLDTILQLFEPQQSADAFQLEGSFTDMLMVSAILPTAAVGLNVNDKIFEWLNYILWALFVFGVMLAFVIPLIPFGLWMMAVIGWIIQFFQLMVNLPLWAATTVGVSDQDSAMAVKVGIKMVISMIIRVPLMMIGLIIAWLLTNVFVQQILSVELIAMALNTGDSNFLLIAVDYLLVFLIYVTMLVIIYNMMFSLIEGFHELAMNWMGDEGTDKLMGQQGQETTAVIGQYKNYTSRLKGLKWNLTKK